MLLAALLAGCRPAPPRVLVVAMEQDVRTLDPHGHDESATHSVLSNLYEPLVNFDREMRIVPALAVAWSNPTDLRWRFQIRPGVRFHDGRPLGASDVRFSLERARRLRPASQLLSVAGVDVLDEATLEVRTTVPDPVLLNKLAGVGIVPADAPDTVTAPVGTGAYRLVERLPGGDLRLAANADHWGGAPPVAEALFRVFPGAAARTAALARGEIHLARDVARSQLAGAPRALRLVSHPGLVVVVLGVNFRTGGPLADRAVRQAIYWALDPAEVVARSGIEGDPVDQIVPPSVFGFLPGGLGPRPQPERARDLLRRAGHAEGLDVTLEIAEGFASELGPVLSEQLGRVGIRTSVVGVDWPRLSARLDRQESPFFSVGWSCNGDASHVFETMLHTRAGAYGASNFGAYGNPELDRLVERAGTLLQPDVRLRVLHEAMRLALDDLPLIPVFNRKRTYAVDERVRFLPRLNGQVVLREISWAGQGPSD